MNFCVIGAGAWGTAVAVHLGRTGNGVSLVARRVDHALGMATTRENSQYLPGIELNHNIQIGCELKPALMEADVVFLAVPSKHLRGLCEEIKAHLESAWRIQAFLTLCKGLELGDNLKPSEIVAEVLPGFGRGSFSGPTYAGEVAAGKPAAVSLGFHGDPEKFKAIQAATSNQSMRVYTTTDLDGVELGGCLKNVYAIAAGICDGLELGDNAKASLVTRALAEMVRIGCSLGGEKESFYGLSGFGDLVATCNGAWSRNRTFGERVARGEDVESLVTEMTVEGYRSVVCFNELCKGASLNAPILREVFGVLYEGTKPLVALERLMARDLKDERG